MPGSRHRSGFSSSSSCPHISYQIFNIKYAQASSLRFWAHCTCYRVTSRHHTERIVHPDCPLKHGGMALVATPGCRHHLQSVWVGVLCILNAFCRGEITSLWRLLNTVSHSFPLEKKNIKSSIISFYFKQIRRSSPRHGAPPVELIQL